MARRRNTTAGFTLVEIMVVLAILVLLVVARRSFRAPADPPSLLTVKLKDSDVRLVESHNHGENFAESVKTRRDPVSNIDDAVRSDIISHVCDIAIRCGRKVIWDPVKEQFVGDEQATRMMTRAWREPWSVLKAV